MKELTPPRKLRRIKPKPKTVKYGYGEQFEGTPKEAAAYWAVVAGQTYEQYRAGLEGPRYWPDPVPAPAAARRSAKPRTISLPRTRSREQSHVPRRSARSTPKAASRSGDSDAAGSSEPPTRRRVIVDSRYLVVQVVA